MLRRRSAAGHIELKLALEICIDIIDLESLRVCMQLQLQALAMHAHVREQPEPAPGSGGISSRTPEHCLRMRIPCGGKLNLDLPRPQPIRRRPYR